MLLLHFERRKSRKLTNFPMSPGSVYLFGSSSETYYCGARLLGLQVPMGVVCKLTIRLPGLS